MSITEKELRSALSGILLPDGQQNLAQSERLLPPVINGDTVYVSIAIDPSQHQSYVRVQQEAEKHLTNLPGVASAIITLTSHHELGGTVASQTGSPLSGHGPALHKPANTFPAANRSPEAPTIQAPASQPPTAPTPISHRTDPHRRAPGQQRPIPDIRHIVAVASGKGGVGKSTTAVNLALGIAANGLKVGLLDADIYGPSLPRLLGTREKPRTNENRRIQPLSKFGITMMSIGLMVEEDAPIIWRGPMVISAITQLLRDVDWGALDVMIVDMPPGTGDAQLTLAQQVPLSGALIVSTPQDLALIDARKAINMFRRVEVPILGIVENMSYFLCPHCGERSDIFSHGGARAEAENFGVPFLGEIPLAMAIRHGSDDGQPILISEPANAHAQLYRTLAANLWLELADTQDGGQHG